MKYRPVCKSCGSSSVTSKGRTEDGLQHFKTICWQCARKIKGYKLHKGDKCERCGFVPKHSCQLDVDHIDGNKLNSDRSNLQTLCANCHRLKTQLERDWLDKTAEAEFAQLNLELFKNHTG